MNRCVDIDITEQMVFNRKVDSVKKGEAMCE